MMPTLPISPELMNTIVVVLEISLAILGAFIAALWISLVIWTFRDIRSRTRDVFAQILATLLVVIFNLPGVVLYLLLRPPEKLTEAYERALEEEALLQDIEERSVCPGCKRHVEPDFMFCPVCHTQLKKRCLECGGLLHLRWTQCPYCGADQEQLDLELAADELHADAGVAQSGAADAEEDEVHTPALYGVEDSEDSLSSPY